MGTFNVDLVIANIADRARTVEVEDALVDTGAEYTWLPSAMLESIGVQHEFEDMTFIMANGDELQRPVGFAIVHAGDRYTIDQVVFAKPGDLTLLGARTLDGLNVRLDMARGELVEAGPLPAAGHLTKRLIQ